MTELREDDIVMCTVKKIEGTTVFVDIEDNGSGTIVMSEIAAGRIRNLRDYVIIGKKIVCKVLKIAKDHTELSLRRVTAKEKDEIKEKYAKERNLFGMLKASTKKPEEVLNKIKQATDVIEFIESARTNPQIIEKFMPKSEAQAFSKILSEKKDKEKAVKKVISIKSFSSSGINDIKSALGSAKDVEIHYLGSSKFSISSKGKDFKHAAQRVQQAIDAIRNKSKEKKLFFECDEK